MIGRHFCLLRKANMVSLIALVVSFFKTLTNPTIIPTDCQHYLAWTFENPEIVKVVAGTVNDCRELFSTKDYPILI